MPLALISLTPSQGHTIFFLGGGGVPPTPWRKNVQKTNKSALGRKRNAPRCKRGVGRSAGVGGYAAVEKRGKLQCRVYTAVQEGVRPNAGGTPQSTTGFPSNYKEFMCQKTADKKGTPGEKFVCVCVCVCFLPIYSGLQVRWIYQPGSHRRKATEDFSSTFLLRCMPLFFSREGFNCSFPSSTVKSNFVY